MVLRSKKEFYAEIQSHFSHKINCIWESYVASKTWMIRKMRYGT